MSLFMKWINKFYLWATEQLYHRFAWAYDLVAWLVSFGNWSNWRRDALKYLQPGKVLEIGFGTGALLSEMTVMGYEAYGLEPSPEMLKAAQRKSKSERISLKVVQADAKKIPFSERTFKNLISTFPSNYIFDEDTLMEIGRVLTSDGRVVITGFGVKFRSDLKNWLTGWFLNKASDAHIELFCQKAEKFEFITWVVQHEEDSYILPIIIMEKKHD